MAKHNKYGSYRGRRNGLKWFASIILIAIIAICLGYFFWGDHSLSWDIFPRFAHEETVVEVETEAPTVELVIDEPEPTAVQTGGLLLATDATLWDEDDLGDFDFLAVTMKDSAGTLYYATDIGSVVWSATAASADENMAYFTQLTTQDTPSVAFLSTLQDPIYASYYVTASALMSDTGFAYKDGNGVTWLDPAKEYAVAWVTDLVRELIALGFDEIVLTDFHYPQSGDLESIRYSEENSVQALEDLLSTIATITKEAGVTLGMEMSSGSLVSGSVPYEDWTDYVDTFYAVTNDLPTATSLVGADHVIVLSEQVPTSGNYLLVP